MVRAAVTGPVYTCPIEADGKVCGAPILEHHWACRRCWLMLPRPFLCNANRYRRGTPEYGAMIERANNLLSGDDSDDLKPPWRR